VDGKTGDPDRRPWIFDGNNEPTRAINRARDKQIRRPIRKWWNPKLSQTGTHCVCIGEQNKGSLVLCVVVSKAEHRRGDHRRFVLHENDDASVCVRYHGKMEIIAVPKRKGSWIDTSSVVGPRGGEVNSERMKHP
jgi:hypothetical protein